MPKTHTAHAYGWLPELPDQRDYVLLAKPVGLPESVDLRNKHMPPVYDQDQLGSCTANAIGAHLDFNRKKEGHVFITPSRLFIYYNERKAQNTVKSDSGATIRGSVKAVVKQGAPHEKVWPYDISKFAVKPPASAISEAVKYEALTYYKVPRSLVAMQGCLALGYPFVIGFTVYESFENIGSDGMMPMPASSEAVMGGHAVMVVGYKQINGQLYFIVRNSWGTNWGDKGYFYMPADYLMNPSLSSDFWTLRDVK